MRGGASTYPQRDEVMLMSNDEPVELFDGEDVDVGDEPPDDDDMTPDEVAAVRASQQAPDTPPADTTEAS